MRRAAAWPPVPCGAIAPSRCPDNLTRPLVTSRGLAAVVAYFHLRRAKHDANVNRLEWKRKLSVSGLTENPLIEQCVDITANAPCGFADCHWVRSGEPLNQRPALHGEMPAQQFKAGEAGRCALLVVFGGFRRALPYRIAHSHVENRHVQFRVLLLPTFDQIGKQGFRISGQIGTFAPSQGPMTALSGFVVMTQDTRHVRREPVPT
jgi:hypothetical protein